MWSVRLLNWPLSTALLCLMKRMHDSQTRHAIDIKLLTSCARSHPRARAAAAVVVVGSQLKSCVEVNVCVFLMFIATT